MAKAQQVMKTLWDMLKEVFDNVYNLLQIS